MKVALTSLLLLAVACNPAPVQDNTTAPKTAPAVTNTEPPAPQEKPMSYYENKVVDLNTSKGTITLRFFPQVAPNHVRNFIDLAESGFYNGTRFHRVIPNFMIQGGDPNTKTPDKGTWGMGGSGKRVNAEFNSIHHARGILSMARANDPNSASSQFFICNADAGFLDNQYTVFGQVVSGMDVVDAITAAPKNGETPVDPVTIETATVREAKDTEKGPLPK